MKNNKSESSVAVLNAPVTVVRGADQIEKLFSFGEDGSAALVKGSAVSAEEIATLATRFVGMASSATIKACNVLRIAKMLPEVEVGSGDAKRKVTAFDYACEKVRENIGTSSAWYNIKGLIEACEVVDANGLKSSPFAVKESLGYLRAAGAFQKVDGKETVKLALHDKVASKLKEGVGVNAVRAVIKEAKAPTPAATPAATPAIAGGAVPETPAPVVRSVAEIQGDLAGTVQREVQSCVGLWDKAVSQGVAVAKLRELCKSDIETLAKLAGFSLRPL